MYSLVVPNKGPRTHTNISVSSSPVLLVGANKNRKSVIFENQGSSVVYLGKEGVATSGTDRGYALFVGSTFTDNASDGAWYAVAGSEGLVHVIEVL